MKLNKWILAGAVTTAMVAGHQDAKACGGCFVPQAENTVVTGHRMVMSISKTQTVLWDQIQYAGEPEEFSWVLPIKPGAHIEVGADAWFEVLDAATTTAVTAAPQFCGGGGNVDGGFGCGAMSSADAAFAGGRQAEPPQVEVVHQGTVGPYETVTLSADDPTALAAWLTSHGYQLPDDIKPVVDAYVDEGFDFIALRLIPGVGVQQMQPVRVITAGAGFALPLRMVAAGTGAKTALSLFVISEGRYQTGNFENVALDPAALTWDFATDSSNYSSLRQEMLAQNNGHSWLTSYARRGPFFSEVSTKVGFSNFVSYQVGTSQARTIAEAYARQGLLNSETSDTSCLGVFEAIAGSDKTVVPACAPDEEGCVPAGADEIDADTLACGTLDDLAVALVGMAPKDVWITRLDAELPRTALATDLQLEAADEQRAVENRHLTDNTTNDPCAPGAVTAPLGKNKGRGGFPGGPVSFALAAALVAWATRRAKSVRAVTAS
jgi:hypothetical protein